VVAAIAVEALVKLLALLAVGLCVVLSFEGGLDGIFASAPQALIGSEALFGPRWVTLTFLAAVAIICLPRQFQVMVVENTNEDHLRTASWLFPLYLFLISLFILPIALAGLATLPPGADPDMFVLTLPLWTDQDMLALLAFLGGFSSATSMVIVACIALSTMISNHIVMPIALNLPGVTLAASGDVKRLLLVSRRIGIGVILFLGFLYFRLSGQSDALAAIGLIAFAAVAQLLPSLIGGIYWRLATAKGALAGLVSGFLIWAYTLFFAELRRRLSPFRRRDRARSHGHRLAAPGGALRLHRHRSPGACDLLEPRDQHRPLRPGLARHAAIAARAGPGAPLYRRVRARQPGGDLRLYPALGHGAGSVRARPADSRRQRGPAPVRRHGPL
jgi:Na+/proline symporter